MAGKPQYLKKIVMLGDGGVGKTSLVKRFKTGYFNPAYLVTLGASITKKDIDLDYCSVVLAIWDIGGQSLFQRLHSRYFVGAEGALAVFDITKHSSFSNLPGWVNSFRDIVGKKPIIFLANKIDLTNHKVKQEDLLDLVDTIENSQFLYTSAKNGTNTNETFSKIAKMMIDNPRSNF